MGPLLKAASRIAGFLRVALIPNPTQTWRGLTQRQGCYADFRSKSASVRLGATWCLGVLLFAHGIAYAERGFDWLPGEEFPGVNGQVFALTTWDPDGPGSHPAVLVVGGDFTVAGDVFAEHIAYWDGIAWHPLDSGIDGRVSSLTVHQGELIAGGSFTIAGGVPARCIARWDGAEWHALDIGVNSAVHALTTFAAT